MALPGWLDHTFVARPTREIKIGKLCVEIVNRGSVSLLRVTIPDAGYLRDHALMDAVYACYRGVGELVREMHSHPIRFWNFIPRILRIHACGMSGYELFNAGRFEALRAWLGDCTSARLAASSAVGAPDNDYTLHVLTDTQPASPVDNPRQITPHCYSKRYGPVPPTFARACLLIKSQRNMFQCSALVSGTASIVGEDTQHRGDLSRQIDETCLNLASVSDSLADKRSETVRDALDRYVDLRVYVPRPDDHVEILSRFKTTFRFIPTLEVVTVDLCRSDLLLEVEGTLRLTA
jgi:enamine deaminase RidA (YjgF/YER057c/UK114 family)